MKPRLWICLLCLLPLFTARADDSPRYRLRTPTPEAYLQYMIDMLPQLSRQDNLSIILVKEFSQYSPTPYQGNWETLYKAYTALYPRYSGFGPFDRRAWNTSIIFAWLKEQKIDLSQVNNLKFKDYQIDVTQRDFNSDGRNEYVLSIRKGAKDASYHDNEYVDTLILQRESGTSYRIVPIPIPWLGSNAPPWFDESGILNFLRFQDVNGDGLPEWMIMHRASNTGPGHGDRATLYVLSWRDGQLVNLGQDAHGTLFEISNEPAMLQGDSTVGWSLEIVDNNSVPEIVKTYPHGNNWHCAFKDLIAYKWNAQADRYQLSSEKEVLEDSWGCAWTQAEEAMWRGDFEKAISWYEHGVYLATKERSMWSRDDYERLFTYERIRLALAYALAGKPEQASALLAQLQAERQTSEPLAKAIDTLSSAYKTQNSISFCTAMYRIFDPHNPDYPMDAYIGQTLVDLENFALNVDMPTPEWAGCNPYHLIEKQLEGQSFTVGISPIRQLANLGINAASEFHSDLNGDSRDEWLVWTEANISPILFVSAINQPNYIVSPSGPLLFRDKNTEFSTRTLPGRGGKALLRWSPDDGNNPDNDYESCFSQQIMGRLEIWRLTGYELKRDSAVLVCEPRTLDQVFLKDGNEIRGWMYDYPSGDVAPTVQIWNDQKNEYELTLWDGKPLEQVVAEFENETNPPPSLEDTVNQIEQQYPNVEAMRQTSPDLEMLVNNPPADTDNHLLVKAHYLHALALEALNRPDDALAEYLALYRAAPDSAWGRLAALHFEPIK